MKNYISNFKTYRIQKRREDIIKESVLQVNDIYRVRTTTDIPQSLINAYVKKVKDSTGKNLRQFFGDVDVAEEIVKYITMNNLDSEKIPANALMGGPQSQKQGQGQPGQSIQSQTQSQGEDIDTQDEESLQGQQGQGQQAQGQQAQGQQAQGQQGQGQQGQGQQGQGQQGQGQQGQGQQGQGQQGQRQGQGQQGQRQGQGQGQGQKGQGQGQGQGQDLPEFFGDEDDNENYYDLP